MAADRSGEPAVDPLVVVNVFGGMVQDVFASIPDPQVIIVDWDCDGCDPSEPGIVEVKDERGGLGWPMLDESPIRPLCQAAATDVETAIETAGPELPLCEC